MFKNRNVFLFTGIVKENSGNFSFFDKEFVSIINSFSNLKEAEKSLALPLKIKLHKVKRGESYNSLSLQSPIPFDPEKKLVMLVYMSKPTKYEVPTTSERREKERTKLASPIFGFKNTFEHFWSMPT